MYFNRLKFKMLCSMCPSETYLEHRSHFVQVSFQMKPITDKVLVRIKLRLFVSVGHCNYIHKSMKGLNTFLSHGSRQRQDTMLSQQTSHSGTFLT